MMRRRTQRTRRILYLSFYFPPSRASGVYRARATANHLARRGWDVTVFAAPLQFLYDAIGTVDEQLAQTVDPRIRVERPSLNTYIWENDLRKFGWFRGTLPLTFGQWHRWTQDHIFPEPYHTWGLAAVRLARKLHRKRRFDLIVATGNPFASFAAAWLLHRLTGVPYVLDYRDSWTLNLFSEQLAFPESHKALTWERRVLRRASGIVFVNEALRRWHATRYPAHEDRMVVVPNGWDADLLDVSDLPVSAGGHRRPLRFAFLGTITDQQPLEELTEAFRRARRHPDMADAELNLYGHLGFFRHSGAYFWNRLGIDRVEGSTGKVVQAAAPGSGIRYCGPVSKTEVAGVYRDNDVLVFLAAGGRYVTSGKVFEYMASGRPIVSVHSADIAATEILRGYPLWFNPNGLDVDEVAQSMVAAAKAARDLSLSQQMAARTYADSFARDNLLAPFERMLRAVVGNGDFGRDVEVVS